MIIIRYKEERLLETCEDRGRDRSSLLEMIGIARRIQHVRGCSQRHYREQPVFLYCFHREV